MDSRVNDKIGMLLKPLDNEEVDASLELLHSLPSGTCAGFDTALLGFEH